MCLDQNMRCQNLHMVKSGGLDAFHAVGSGLWTILRITLNVYEYVRVRYFINKSLLRIVISDNIKYSQQSVVIYYSLLFKSALIMHPRALNSIYLVFPCFFMAYRSCQKNICHDLIPYFLSGRSTFVCPRYSCGKPFFPPPPTCKMYEIITTYY